MPIMSASKRKWDKLAATWTLAGPPASPSLQDVGNYAQFLSHSGTSRPHQRVMILGCTPSLRDLFATHPVLSEVEVVCIDFSQKMYARSSKFVSVPNARERFAEADWLSMDLGQNNFSAIVGDKVFDNILPEDWHRFVAQLHRHLAPGGIFVTRLACQNMRLEGHSFMTLLSKWSSTYEHNSGNLSECVSALWEELLGASAFVGGRHNTQSISRFISEINSLKGKLQHVGKHQRVLFVELLRLFEGSFEDVWSSYTFDDIVTLMADSFRLQGTLLSEDYAAAERQPVVLFAALP